MKGFLMKSNCMEIKPERLKIAETVFYKKTLHLYVDSLLFEAPHAASRKPYAAKPSLKKS